MEEKCYDCQFAYIDVDNKLKCDNDESEQYEVEENDYCSHFLSYN